MSRQEIEVIAADAIRKASGKKLSEAIKILADEIERYVPALSEEAFVVGDIPPAVIPSVPIPFVTGMTATPTEKLEELAPIGTSHESPRRSVYREYRNVNDIMDAVTRNSPATITVKVAGPDGGMDLELVKSVSMVNDGVQLAYRPKGSSAETPCPKAFFWNTDESLDINKSIEAMKLEAEKIYVRRPAPPVTRVVDMGPVERRMNAGESV